MFLTKKHLSRRTLLRGISLPFLSAMVPAQTPVWKTAAMPAPRLACIEMVHGAAGSTDEGMRKNYWSPRQEGKNFEFSYSLEPLAALRKYITVISGTDARPAEAFAPSEGGADHFRSSAVFLTAAHAKQTSGPDIYNGVSIDQLYAQRIGKGTPVPSLQLCIENIGLSESCGFDYSCIYSETISWASPTAPLPMTVNPRVVFEKLFRVQGVPGKRSVLDGIGPDVQRMSGELGGPDRVRLHGYLEDIRRIEQRIEAIEKHNARVPERELTAAPLGVPDSWEEHVNLMIDLQVLAFAADITRVSAFKMSRDTSNRFF